MGNGSGNARNWGGNAGNGGWDCGEWWKCGNVGNGVGMRGIRLVMRGI